MIDEFNVSLETCLEKQMSFEAYFIIWSLYNSKEKELLSYVETCRKIPTEEFINLQEKGYLLIAPIYDQDKKLQVTFHGLKLTKLGKELFEKQDFNSLFEEFKACYPSTVGKAKRRLHTDLKRCKLLYKKIINDDISRHNLLCICAKLYFEEKQRSGSETFMQNLPTWLHQENYEAYMEEAMKISNSDNKTTKNEGNIDRI